MAETPKIDIEIRSENLLRGIKTLNITRLAKMRVDLFGFDKPFEKIGSLKG